MEAILKFNLPDEQEDYDRCNAATSLCDFIWDFQQYLRSQWKYSETPDSIDVIYEKWFEELNNHNINLDDIYR